MDQLVFNHLSPFRFLYSFRFQLSDLPDTPRFRMPTSRAKSCDHCRAAKARCSLATPCSRCAKRSLECRYSPARTRSSDSQRLRKDFRPILPITSAPSTTKRTTNDGDPRMSRSTSMIKASDAILPDALSTLAEISFPSSGTISEDSVFAEMVKLVDTDIKTPDLAIYQSDTPSLFDMHMTSSLSHEVSSESKSLGASDNGSIYPCFVDPLSTYNPLNLPYPMVNLGFDSASSPVLASIDFSSPELLTTAANSPDVLRKPHLSTRERSFQQGSLTAKMLLSQLMDYTHRIADGKTLPPFIHAPCFISRDDECPPDTPHSCLPKPLAICRSLTQMFYSRTPGSNGFIWQQIYTHMSQMHAEVSLLLTLAIVVKEKRTEAITSIKAMIGRVCYKPCRRLSSTSCCVRSARIS